MAEEREEFEDAASLVDAVFGASATSEAAEEPEDQATGKGRGEEEAEEAVTEPGSAVAEAEAEVETEVKNGARTEAEGPEGETGAKNGAGTGAGAPEGGAEAENGSEAENGAEAGAETGAGAETEATPPEDEAAEPEATASVDPSPAVARPLSGRLTRGRLVAVAAAAAVAVIGVATAGVVLLSGGGSGNAAAAAPTTAPSTTQPSVNPQAFYPVQSASPFTAGGVSELTDARIQAAVPGCDSCKLVTRANKFSPDGSVLALLRTGTPQAGKSNAKLVVVGADGHLVWSAPDGFKGLTAGIERFSVDGAGNHYLALPGPKYGQVLVILAWRDGKVQDLGGLLDPKIKSDSIVGVLPQGTGAGGTATIVSQTTDGVPDADTGGLVESQYQIKDGAPVLTGCRRHVGESGQWLTFAPSSDGCTHWPAGPVGPPDDDEPTTSNH
jgi:hypothetical protein